MMIMTIWWSKATRLLEFSRSKFAPRHEEEVGLLTCGPGFFVTEEDRGIVYSSKWMLSRITERVVIRSPLMQYFVK